MPCLYRLHIAPYRAQSGIARIGNSATRSILLFLLLSNSHGKKSCTTCVSNTLVATRYFFFPHHQQHHHRFHLMHRESDDHLPKSNWIAAWLCLLPQLGIHIPRTVTAAERQTFSRQGLEFVAPSPSALPMVLF